MKPVHGTYGRGTYSLNAYDPDKRTFETARGNEISLDEILEVGQKPQYGGLLIQEKLKPHASVLLAAGGNTSCARVILIRDGNKAFIQSAFWKIARTHSITDNFTYGRHGNLIGNIDVATGEVRRVINGLWPTGQDVTIHPETGKRLSGFTLPQWQPACELPLEASHVFSGLRLQSWDVAFCEEGPILLELNTEPDLQAPQMLAGAGFIDDRLQAVLNGAGW